MPLEIPDQFDLPVELCTKALPLIGVTGLDTINNAIHKSIWETFNNRRVERAPVVFKLIDNAHEFPVVKPKRNSYEWYIPKGILKRNWMNKHLNEVPAVIVIFYDLDWNDSQWNEKIIECASRVQSMRAALEGRNTRIVVVLIQNTPPLPAGEDILATDRAVALCASCELTAKSLYVLPHGDHLQGYAVRLENAFYDLAQNYYHSEARNIKSHREHLNKNSHQFLFVRHQFKMGFLNEMKQDNHTAHKHYTHAYNNLLEIRIVDTNAMEIRTVAGFINYKLCRLMFNLNLPRDAISQFRGHMDRFKQRMGFQELAFEHSAWMSKQFNVFGDIFDEAVKLGLPAVQTQHPGIYYQQAAQYAITRKKLCQELCNAVVTYPQPDPLEGINNMEFYGQRPWRRGKINEPTDPQLENNGIQALQFIEKQINISSIIIALYGLAISQYKTYRCPRTRRHLVVQMADEYYNSEDYGKALTLLTHMLWDYRAERWWSIISAILQKALNCAYLTANIQDYIIICLEMLGKSIPVTLDVKKRVYENLMKILQKQIPDPEPTLTSNSNILNLWKVVMNKSTLDLSLDVGNIASCIDCKAKFSQVKYQADEKVTVELFIRINCPFSLTFTRVSITISTPEYSSEFAVSDQRSNPTLVFHPNEVKRFLIEFTPDPNDVEKEIQIGSINLNLSNSADTKIDLKLSGIGNDKNYICQELLHFKNSPHNMPDFDNIRSQTTATIVPHNSKLCVNYDHPKPALLGEWYSVNIVIMNDELCHLRDIKFEMSLADDIGLENTEFSLKLDGPLEKLPLNLALNDLAPSETASIQFVMRAHKIGDRNLNIKFNFMMEKEKSVASVKNDVLIVPVVKPFELTSSFLSTMFEDITKFYVGETFVAMPVINCLSPWTIVLEETKLEFGPSILNMDESIKSQITGVHLDDSESAVEMFLVAAKKQSEQCINVGQYTIKWKRFGGRTTINQFPITGLTVDWIPLDISVSLPAHGFVRTPLLITYHLSNRSQQLVQLDINMEASEAFMYAGYKQCQISILPESVKVMEYNLYPLIAGNVALPKLALLIPENSTEGPALRQDQVNLLLERSLPTHLFVMPQVKGAPNIPDVAQSISVPLVQ